MTSEELGDLKKAVQTDFTASPPDPFSKVTKFSTPDGTSVASHDGLTGTLSVGSTRHDQQVVFAGLVATFYRSNTGVDSDLS